MKEQPILFSAPMVRAILEGKKTQTRRIIKCDHEIEYSGRFGWRYYDPEIANYKYIKPRYGILGDKLWVKETWGVGTRPCPHEGWYDGIEYRADEAYLEEDELLSVYRVQTPAGVELDEYAGHGWRPSIYMPRWASRITLEIKSVRVERLQDISEEDARAEGARCLCPELDEPLSAGGKLCGASYRYGFKELWSSINGKDSWALNPWVWRIEFYEFNNEGEKP